MVYITWSCIAVNVLNFNISAANICAGSPVIATITSSTIADGTYSVTYSLSGVNTTTNATATMIFAAGKGTFSTTPVSNSGATTVTVSTINCTSVQSNNSAGFTVNSLPIITGTFGVCLGATTQLSAVGSTPAASNPWVSASPLVATVSSTGLVNSLTAGTSLITYTDINGCTASVTVTVNAIPTISGLLSLCNVAGSTTQLSGSGSPALSTPWNSSATAVATVDNTGLVTRVSNGSTNITYTDINGCVSAASSVTVNTLPVVSAGSSVCVGSL